LRYAYEDLSYEQFETLVLLLCQRLLGISVQGFAVGPDGGRDGKFVGTAELHPSKAAPWVGITIIQAKHTNGYNCTFSDPDFFNPNNTNTVIGKEIPRIKKLCQHKQLDNYILFSNRRLAGSTESRIRTHITEECSIPEESISLYGVEQIELLLRTFSDIPQLANLDPIDSPLIVSSEDLASVVQALASNKDGITIEDDPPRPRMPYEKKNKINDMTPTYAQAQRTRYLKETAQIHAFLAAPENSELLRIYENVVDEFQLKIIAKRKEYQQFDEVMNYLADILFKRDPILRQNKRLTRTMLFYMYWNCDIGEEDNA